MADKDAVISVYE